MAKKETKNEPKDLIEPIPEEISKLKHEIEASAEVLEVLPEETKKELTRGEMRAIEEAEATQRRIDAWVPKTKLGLHVKQGEIKEIDEILSSGKKILEPEIVESLINLESDLLLVGQAKGKFGGGKRRAWRQTQKKTMEGNVVTFSSMAIVGDKQSHVGLGYGKSKETLPARSKALRNAKLNIIKVTRGFESQESDKSDPHTVPYVVEGKCGSVSIKLIPAPRGTGLVISDECKKILKLAGIRDVYSVTKGQTRTTINLAKACIFALQKTNKMLL